MDWDSDPELREMRRDFVASFAGRRAELARLAGVLGGPAPVTQEAMRELLFVAHRLAGTARTYGFPLLSEVGAALEEWAGAAGSVPAEGVPYARLLAEMLEAEERSAGGSAAFESDERLRRLFVVAGRVS